MAPRVFIDGEAGTTGLQIHRRLHGRRDIELDIPPSVEPPVDLQAGGAGLAVDENSWSHLEFLEVSVKEKGRFDLSRSAPASPTVARQRFENWKLRRALA